MPRRHQHLVAGLGPVRRQRAADPAGADDADAQRLGLRRNRHARGRDGRQRAQQLQRLSAVSPWFLCALIVSKPPLRDSSIFRNVSETRRARGSVRPSHSSSVRAGMACCHSCRASPASTTALRGSSSSPWVGWPASRKLHDARRAERDADDDVGERRSVDVRPDPLARLIVGDDQLVGHVGHQPVLAQTRREGQRPVRQVADTSTRLSRGGTSGRRTGSAGRPRPASPAR